MVYGNMSIETFKAKKAHSEVNFTSKKRTGGWVLANLISLAVHLHRFYYIFLILMRQILAFDITKTDLESCSINAGAECRRAATLVFVYNKGRKVYPLLLAEDT